MCALLTTPLGSRITAAWARQGLTTESGAKTLESSLILLLAAGLGEWRTTSPENPTSGIEHLPPSRSSQGREIEKRKVDRQAGKSADLENIPRDKAEISGLSSSLLS